MSLEDRIRKYTPCRPEGRCWEWTGCKDARGYGAIRDAGKTLKAHRVVYEIEVGGIPTGKLLRHTCDNPGCVAPNHLVPGTDADNSRDCVLKGRHAHGSRVGTSKLIEDQVLEIITRFKGGASNKELSHEYRVSPATISMIVSGYRWRHLN